MPYSSGTAEVRDTAAEICRVPEAGVRLKNLGQHTVYFGDEDTGADGFPLEPGQSETFPGIKVKESPVVPAPEGDQHLPALYARTADGEGPGKVAWMTLAW